MKRGESRKLFQQLLSLASAGRIAPASNYPVTSSLSGRPLFSSNCGHPPERLTTSCTCYYTDRVQHLEKAEWNSLNSETLNSSPSYLFSGLSIFNRSNLAFKGHGAAHFEGFEVMSIAGAYTGQSFRRIHDSGFRDKEKREWLENKPLPSDGNVKEMETPGPHVPPSSAWTDKEINWPNAISLARLVSGPYLAYLVMQEHFGAAFIGLGLAGISDWLDGYVARRQNIDSILGSYLDPLADKVLVSSVALAMTIKGLLSPYLLVLVVGRDVGLVGGAFYVRARQLNWKWSGWWHFFQVSEGGAPRMQPLFLSKVNTVAQMALVAAALGLPAAGVEDSYNLVSSLCNVVTLTTIVSGAQYAYLGIRRPL